MTKKINNLFTKKIEQGFGPNSQEVDCVGETPEQDENPGDNCFSARGELRGYNTISSIFW